MGAMGSDEHMQDRVCSDSHGTNMAFEAAQQAQHGAKASDAVKGGQAKRAKRGVTGGKGPSRRPGLEKPKGKVDRAGQRTGQVAVAVKKEEEQGAAAGQGSQCPGAVGLIPRPGRRRRHGQLQCQGAKQASACPGKLLPFTILKVTACSVSDHCAPAREEEAFCMFLFQVCIRFRPQDWLHLCP